MAGHRDSHIWRLAAHAAGLGVSLCLAAVIHSCLFSPSEKSRRRSDVRAASREQLVGKASALASGLEHLQGELSSAEGRLESLCRRVPDDAGEADMLALVHAAAQSHGVEVKDYMPGPTTRDESCSRFSVQVNCEGSFDELCAFFSKLDHLPRLCRVSSLRIEAGAGRTHSAAFTLEAYFGLIGPSDGVRSKRQSEAGKSTSETERNQ